MVDRSGEKPKRRITFSALFEDGTTFEAGMNGKPEERGNQTYLLNHQAIMTHDQTM